MVTHLHSARRERNPACPVITTHLPIPHRSEYLLSMFEKINAENRRKAPVSTTSGRRKKQRQIIVSYADFALKMKHHMREKYTCI